MYTRTQLTLYHTQISHLRRNLHVWKYGRTESKCLCSVQMEKENKDTGGEVNQRI